MSVHPQSIQRRRPIAGTKSTPTKLSESSDEDEAYDDSSSSINISGKKSNESSYGSKSSVHNSEQKTSKNEPPKRSYIPESVTSRSGLDCSKLIWFIPVLAAVAIGFMYMSSKNDCTFEKLSQKYSNQNGKIWDTLSSGINNINYKKSNQPGVYLFVAENGSKMEKIVKSIAEHTSQCFDKKLKLIEMTEKDFTSTSTIVDFGHVIEIFKEKLKDGRVALIVNLNKIPAESARALHFICDTYSPIATDIVIYLTLVVPSTMDKPIQAARNTLTDLWGSKLKNNELDPLITRVMDEVIAIK